LTEKHALQVLIEVTARGIKENYEVDVRTVGELKGRMNELELEMSKKENMENKDGCLAFARKELNRLTDSTILRSKEAWKKYEALKQDCETQAFESAQLDELWMWCKKAEQLAADLLCYSLGALPN